MKSAETFLRNRKWIVGSGTGLREALAYMIQKKPEFILIAADHPNKKVKVLPKILLQAFQVKIMAYAEGSGGASIAALHEMGVEYTLFPPVSGPSIERIILKMKRDDERRQKEAEERKKLGLDTGPSPDEVIRLKGAEGGGPSMDSVQAALSQLMSDGDGDSGGVDAGGTFVAKGDSNLKPGMGYSGGQSGSGDSSSAAGGGPQWTGSGDASGNSGGFGGMGSLGGHGSMGQMGGGNAAGGGMGANESYADWEERMRKQRDMQHNGQGKDSNGGARGDSLNDLSEDALRAALAGQGKTGAKKTGQENGENSSDQFPSGMTDESNSNSEDDPELRGALTGRKNQVPIMESGPIKKKEKLTPRYKSDPRTDRNNDSIIIRGTQQALDDSVHVEEGLEVYQEVQNSSHCACIIVESERFSGYLVAALGKNRQIDKNFIDMIRERLFSFLKAHGEVIKNEQGMEIKLQEIQFEDWALEQADFLKKSIHGGDEIAMAFFPTKETSIKLEESVSEKMLKMEISELKEDTAVEFDLYIYMPENNKYLLYTPQGKPLHGAQRSRLTEKGVTHMHLRKESAHNVKKYRAQNYLNEKIEAFKAAQKIKNG